MVPSPSLWAFVTLGLWLSLVCAVVFNQKKIWHVWIIYKQDPISSWDMQLPFRGVGWWEEGEMRGKGTRAATKSLASFYQLLSPHCMCSAETGRWFHQVDLSMQPTWRRHGQAAGWWFSSSWSCWQHCRWWLHGTGRGSSQCCLKRKEGIGSERAARSRTCRNQKGCIRQLFREIHDMSYVKGML